MAYCQPEKRFLMPDKQNDILDRLKEHRQQMDVWQQQQATFQVRLEMFHQRQQELREHLEMLRGDKQYLEMLKQMNSKKRFERPLARIIRL
jgi:ribosomal protein S15P/S13E